MQRNERVYKNNWKKKLATHKHTYTLVIILKNLYLLSLILNFGEKNLIYSSSWVDFAWLLLPVWVLLGAESFVFFGNKIGLIFGKTPPWAMVTPANNLFNSSSLRIANCKCLGMILDFLLSLAAFPANSRTSAAKYSRTADK